MGRIFALVILLAAAAGFSGCASEEQQNDPNRVSTIPWNRPESWEGQGALGGMMNQQSR